MTSGDLYSIETADGLKEYFPSATQAFKVMGGLGAPPIAFKTYRGYKHTGETEFDYALQPRIITIDLWNAATPTRADYWDARARFINLLRPNRGGPMTLTVLTPDGSKRSIVVRANPGLMFPPAPDVNNWSIDEMFEFIAFDPIWFDSAETALTGINGSDEQLNFPIEFPIYFGEWEDVVFSSGDLTYSGTWKSYPRFVLNGPYEWARITSTAVDASIALTIPVEEGDARIIDLTPGRQSVTDAIGTNRFGELSPDSNLVDFALHPDPIAAGGVQRIDITMAGKGDASGATMTYRNRYFAI